MRNLQGGIMSKRATLEILDPGEKIFGSHTTGKYLVQMFDDDEPRGGQFFKTIEEAEKHMVEYEAGDETDTKVLLQE